MYDGWSRPAASGSGGSHEPQPEKAAPKGSVRRQQERRAGPQGFSSEQDSPRLPHSSQSAHKAVGVSLAADHKAAGVGRGGEPDRRREGSSVSPCRNPAPRFAPKGPDSRDPERSQTELTREPPALKSSSASRGAKDPVAEAVLKPQQPSMFSSLSRWFGSKDAGFGSSGTSCLGSSTDQLEQSKEEAKTTWKHFQANEDAMASDTDMMKNKPVEAQLQALGTSSHPQSLELLQALERPLQIMVDLLAENQLLKELNRTQTFQVPFLQAEDSQQPLLKQQGSQQILIRRLTNEILKLKQEVRELKNTQVALQAENQKLREELEKPQKGLVPESEATSGDMPVPQRTVFPVQVQVTGPTGGCEKQFLGDVAKLLVGHKVSLQVEEYQEDSPHLLLLFSVITSREGTNIDDALSGLQGVQKALMVVLHHKPKNNTRFFADHKPQVQHPVLVATVHACFSVHDGFYYCPVNEDAVVSVAETIVQLACEN